MRAEIKQLVGARSYYRCDNAMMITTSSFDAAARKTADEEEIIIWDWHRLHQTIADTFLEGNYQLYFEKYPVALQPVDADLGFRLISIDLTRRKLSLEGRTIVHAELENRSDEPLQVYCDLPVYVTHQRRQFSALAWTPESFSKGEIYGKAVVPISFSFSNKQLSKYHRQDRIILKAHSIVSGETVIMEQKMKKLKKECFFITLTYGRDSQIYTDMITFREEVLLKKSFGRLLVRGYYGLSRRLVSELSRLPFASSILKPFLWVIVSFCRLFIDRRAISSSEQ